MTTCRGSLFSLFLAARYQPAASRFRQKFSARAASGDYGTARILAIPWLLFAVLAASKSAKNVQRPKNIERARHLVVRCIQTIQCNPPMLVFPAKAGTHFSHGHRPSPV
jgi:hypothetical protein